MLSFCCGKNKAYLDDMLSGTINISIGKTDYWTEVSLNIRNLHYPPFLYPIFLMQISQNIINRAS